jgi:hypothetical protein
VLEGHPDVVFIAIPGAPNERLELVQNACAEARIECLVVRREIDPAPLSVDPVPTANVRSIHSRGRG